MNFKNEQMKRITIYTDLSPCNVYGLTKPGYLYLFFKFLSNFSGLYIYEGCQLLLNTNFDRFYINSIGSIGSHISIIHIFYTAVGILVCNFELHDNLKYSNSNKNELYN